MLCRRWQREVVIRPPDRGRGGNAFQPEGRAAAACVQPLRGQMFQTLLFGAGLGVVDPEQQKLIFVFERQIMRLAHLQRHSILRQSFLLNK